MKRRFLVAVYCLLSVCCNKADLLEQPAKVTAKVAANADAGAKKRPKNYNAPVLEYIVYDRYHKDSCLVQYPLNYDSTKKYPLLVTFHANIKRTKKGIYQMSGLIHQIVYDKLQVPFNFITIMPKDKDGLRPASNIDFIVEYAKKKWAVDSTKIYMTGFSAGAVNCVNYLTDPKEYSRKVAAAYLVSCEPVSGRENHLYILPKNNCHVRFMTGYSDTTCYKWTNKAGTIINKYAEGYSENLYFDGDHSCCNIQRYNIDPVPSWADFLNKHSK